MTIYQRIMVASKKGKGLRLSAEDVKDLSMDDAISLSALNDDGETSIPSCKEEPNPIILSVRMGK